MFNLNTINDIFSGIAASSHDRVVLAQNETGAWNPLSSAQIYQRVRALGCAFRDWGIGRGDRIALLSENRWEWPVTDFAVLAIGAVDVPIYPTLTAEQTAVLLADSGCRVAVVSTRKQFDKVASIREQTSLEHIVLMDGDDEPSGAVLFSSLMKGADERGTTRDAEFDQLASAVTGDDLATIIYTSGTTGEPKGVMLTHGNIASNVNYSTDGYKFSRKDTCISFLPLSHITARHLDYALLCCGATLAYCPYFDQLPAAMQSVQPTILVAVPRVYEKIRQEVDRRASLSRTRHRILGWAVATGRNHRNAVMRGETPRSPLWRLADKLVFTKVRAAFGGRVQHFISGGAPLGMETATWFAAAGICVREGYGLTETSPVIAINTPAHYRIGSVGKPLPNVECRLAGDGELLVRGPGVFHGYWQKEAETAASFEGDGWFRTGDIARIDADGFLFITDRKKEMLKTSGGKLIAPQSIENQLKAHMLVAQAALVGDRHKFASVLISPNFPALEDWARSQGIAVHARKQLVVHPQVVAVYQGIVTHVNSSLAQFEKIKRLKIVADEWAIESGELTPSMKLKRRVIYQRYADVIQDFYLDEASSHRE